MALYDPTPQIARPETLEAQFLAFCKGKDAGEEYEYGSCKGCAFSQFLVASGLSSPGRVSCSTYGWTDSGGDRRPMPDQIDRYGGGALIGRPRTFGALADRLENAR